MYCNFFKYKISILNSKIISLKNKTVLENNNCTLIDNFYKQITGAAMGTIFALTYATFIIGYLGAHLYDTCKVEWVHKFRE